MSTIDGKGNGKPTPGGKIASLVLVSLHNDVSLGLFRLTYGTTLSCNINVMVFIKHTDQDPQFFG